MPPIILDAKDYGYRKIIRVCMNPEDPEQVHIDAGGNATAHTGDPPPGTDPALRPWEWCDSCRYNWNVREFIWTEDEMYKRAADGRRIQKSNADLLNEIKAKLTGPAPPETISALVDSVL